LDFTSNFVNLLVERCN